jgi:hypothetical protein
MEPGKVVRDQLLQLLGGGNAHMVFNQAVEKFPLEKINARPPGSDYTPWRLLEHMRIAQWDIVEFVRNPNHISPPWPEGYWPPEGQAGDESRWNETIQKFHQDLQAMQAIVENPETDLFGDLSHAAGYTILREVLVLADHNAYHMGEFALMRQVIGAWPTY